VHRWLRSLRHRRAHSCSHRHRPPRPCRLRASWPLDQQRRAQGQRHASVHQGMADRVKTRNPCRQATAYRCPHFDRVDRQAMTITATSDNQILKSNIRIWAIGLQTFATGSLPRSGLVHRDVMERGAESAGSICLDACELHHLAPLLGFLDDQLAEVSGRTSKHRAAEVSEPRFHVGIGEASVDLLV
jgi:hypothetical protein